MLADPFAREQWGVHAEVYGAGVTNPGTHSEDYLRSFLQLYHSGARLDRQGREVVPGAARGRTASRSPRRSAAPPRKREPLVDPRPGPGRPEVKAIEPIDTSRHRQLLGVTSWCH